jgi:hypothetical protein
MEHTIERYFGLLIVGTLIITSCTQQSEVKIYTPDKKECITVITEGAIRYLIEGDIDYIPADNYVKVSLEGMSGYADALYICWGDSGLVWDLCIEHAIVLEDKLDPDRYQFRTKIELDSLGFPTAARYSRNNCTTVVFDTRRVIPNGSAVAVFHK